MVAQPVVVVVKRLDSSDLPSVIVRGYPLTTRCTRDGNHERHPAQYCPTSLQMQLQQLLPAQLALKILCCCLAGLRLGLAHSPLETKLVCPMVEEAGPFEAEAQRQLLSQAAMRLNHMAFVQQSEALPGAILAWIQ